MDVPELPDGHPRVDLGGGQVRMAEQGLDEANVGAILEHVSGASVSEGMARAGNAHSRA